MLALLASGCGRIDTLRLSHANGGTHVDWPAAVGTVTLVLERDADGRPWLPVSVDGNPAAPFLLLASAGAIALTGAQAPAQSFPGAGRLQLGGRLLPGVGEGVMLKNRRLALGPVSLSDQTLLLVSPEAWPYDSPGGGAAGVIGYDLLRRFVLRLDPVRDVVVLHRPGSFDFRDRDDIRRLAVLKRRPYVEARMERSQDEARWLRVLIDPGLATGFCLDRPTTQPADLELAGFRFRASDESCPDVPDPRAGREGAVGGHVLGRLDVVIDYEGGRVAFSDASRELR